MGQGISPHEKLTSDVGFSVGKVSKIVGEESNLKATSADGYNSMGAQVYPLPAIGHLSDIQTGVFYEEPNEKGQEWTWPEQDLVSKGANLELEASKQLYTHNWPKMNEQMPNEVCACPDEITPKCIVNKGSNCQIVGRKLLNTMDEESRHSRWEEFRRFASRDTITEECSTLLKRMELEASDDEEEMINVEDMMTLEESGVLPTSELEENIIQEETEKKV